MCDIVPVLRPFLWWTGYTTVLFDRIDAVNDDGATT
jgi:hypothetical protein